MKYLIIITCLIGLSEINTHATTIIKDIVIYDPSQTVASLCDGNLSFDEIDISRPENVLFCKTRTKTTNQVAQLYTASANENEYMMEMIRNREISPEIQKEWSEQRLIFSFYYYGNHGPPHWFCFIETPDSDVRASVFFELEDQNWKQGVNVRKYPVRVAFFEISEKNRFYDPTKKLSKNDIDEFINECRNIDDIITTGMAENPEHYGPVQILR